MVIVPSFPNLLQFGPLSSENKWQVVEILFVLRCKQCLNIVRLHKRDKQTNTKLKTSDCLHHMTMLTMMMMKNRTMTMMT